MGRKAIDPIERCFIEWAALTEGQKTQLRAMQDGFLRAKNPPVIVPKRVKRDKQPSLLELGESR